MQVNRQVVRNAGKRTEMYVRGRDSSQGREQEHVRRSCGFSECMPSQD